ncbi:MAG TPA: hypothetical protein VJW77_03615 [Terriglobia bacterium]|nr:hypothetical protein [Terriglobia bacterium]
MKKLVAMLFTIPLALTLSLPAFAQSAAKQTRHYKEHAYYGDISDSNCGAHHQTPANAHACTLGCIQHGAKYVFVSRGKVLMIENQKLPDLEKFAGEHVRITGTRSADGKGISITAIRAASRRTAKKKA